MGPVNYDTLIPRWFEVAENDVTKTITKIKLYEDTKAATSYLNELIDERTLSSAVKAKEYGKIISNSFNTESEEIKQIDPDKLIRWVGKNTFKLGNSVEGAHKVLHDLFEALKRLDLIKLSSEDTDIEYQPFTELYRIIFRVKAPVSPNLKTENEIESSALALLSANDASIHGHGHVDRLFSHPVNSHGSIMNMDGSIQKTFGNHIVNTDYSILDKIIEYVPQEIDESHNYDINIDYSERRKQIKANKRNISIMREISKDINQKDSIKLKLFTKVPCAIEYAKKCGKLIKDIDISGLDFGNSFLKIRRGDAMQDFLHYLPELKTLKAQNSGINQSSVEIILSSNTAKNLKSLDLSNSKMGKDDVFSPVSYNKIGDDEANLIAASKNLINLETLNLANNDISYWGISHILNLLTTSKLKKLECSINQIPADLINDLKSLAQEKEIELIIS